jgi:hypothetical protein
VRPHAEQLIADAKNIVETMGLRSAWPNVTVISLAHSYGFSNVVLPLALHGIPLIIARGALPEALREAAEDIILLARQEGLTAHAKAVAVRFGLPVDNAKGGA